MGLDIIIVLLVIIAIQLWGVNDRLRNGNSAQEKELRELLLSELRYRRLQREGDIEIHRDQLAQAQERTKERDKKFVDDFMSFTKKPE